MLQHSDLNTVIGSEAYDANGDKIGKVGQVYLDDSTDQPSWLTVNTGLFGTNESFVPVEGASLSGDRVTLSYDKAKVKGAPQVASDGHISPDEEQDLYRYYGLSRDAGQTGETFEPGWQAGDERFDRSQEPGVVGHDTSGPTTDSAMTRSEEQLRVGKQSQEAGRARLRKYVTTETQTETVPVRKERAVVEREPITDANKAAATDGPAISEEEHEVILQEEVPVAEKVATPVERVRLGTEEVTEEQTVSSEVRKENIEVEGDADTR